MSKLKNVVNKIFEKYDANNNNTLDITEAWDFLNECLEIEYGESPTTVKLEFFQEIDKNNDNKITREELEIKLRKMMGQ